jgi:hypothetical protein
MAVHRVVTATLAGFLAMTAPALAKLPRPKTTLIVPGKSLAGVRLDMTRAQAFGQWGATSCPSPGYCQWVGPGNPGKAERATVSFVKGKVTGISITAASTGTNLKFKPGVLSKWRTAKGIRLGSKKSAVPRAYPSAKPNNGEAVQGYDLFAGARPNLSYTRFSTPGYGATPTLIRGLEVNWDVCHYFRETCGQSRGSLAPASAR